MDIRVKKILAIQSRTQPERIRRERENFRRAIGESAEVQFLSVLDEKLAWASPGEFLKGFDSVILGGSSDFDFNGGRDKKDPARLVSFIILTCVKNIVSHALKKDFPLLGVCFGHQIIAQMHAGEVDNDKLQGKFGAYEVALTEEGARDPFFSALPRTFFAQYAHKDSATKLPEGSVLLGKTANCRFAVLRYGARAYTTQFHPEVERMGVGPYYESSEASSILPLWIKRVVAGSG